MMVRTKRLDRGDGQIGHSWSMAGAKIAEWRAMATVEVSSDRWRSQVLLVH